MKKVKQQSISTFFTKNRQENVVSHKRARITSASDLVSTHEPMTPESSVESTSTSTEQPALIPSTETTSINTAEPTSSGTVDVQECSLDSIKDIADNMSSAAPDQVKYYFIENRQPHSNFKFPAKLYKDKRRKDGQMKRYCCREWFDKFDFICYSVRMDGLFCLACLFFPDTAHRRPNLLVKDAYRNWKDAVSDLKSHTSNAYHIDSKVKITAFKKTFCKPSARIDLNIGNSTAERIRKNRVILTSILKCIEFCGRQGISLRGHRDDDTEKSLNKGNFKNLVDFRADSGDSTLKDHLETCAKNATYISKNSQNDLLDCIKQYFQKCIVDEVKQQKIGPYFGYQCDEVRDSSNWEQLGIVLRYTVNNRPVERLLAFVECEQITGAAICDKIVKSVSDAGLDVQFCRSQTMDGAGNMSGKQAGCAARFKLISPKATYHYCSSHDLNLALCKSCKLKEIQCMLDTLKQLGLFFKYSPKRSRRLEEAISEYNSKVPKTDQISKSKFHVFCETRWVEKFSTLRDFHTMYVPMLDCLEAIGQTSTGWDTKAITDAYGLLNRITDSNFIMCFQTILLMFGYVTGLSSKLQGSTLDIIEAYEMVNIVKNAVSAARNKDAEMIFQQSSTMARKAGLDCLQMPRRCGRQTQRNNVPANNTEEYFVRAIFNPFVDSLIQQLDMRFNSMTRQACLALCLLPNNMDKLTEDAVISIVEHYQDDMPQPETFQQELQLWKLTWRNKSKKPATITETLSETCNLMYPNIFKVLTLVLLTSVTSASVERSNSSLRFIKNAHRSTMGQGRFNALMLLFMHRDIKLDFEQIINDYARKYPRRMLLINPLSE